MKTTETNGYKESLLNVVKEYIPKEIPMTPKAFLVGINQEKTINQMKAKVKKDVLKNASNFTEETWNSIEDDVEYIISKRIVITSSPNME